MTFYFLKSFIVIRVTVTGNYLKKECGIRISNLTLQDSGIVATVCPTSLVHFIYSELRYKNVFLGHQVLYSPGKSCHGY